MRGAVLPAALLLATLALLLAFQPRRIALALVLLATAVALAGQALYVPLDWTELVFAGCWASLFATAIGIYLPRPAPLPVAMLLTVNAGLWAGLVIAAEGQPFDIVRAIPALLLLVPASLIVHRGYAIALRVVTSWLVAVALLAVVLPHVVTHPGYVPDHME